MRGGYHKQCKVWFEAWDILCYVEFRVDGWDYNLMFRGLFLILGLLGLVWASEAELGMQGSLKIKENTYDKKTQNKILTVRAAINSPQYNNILHRAVQVIVPTPSHGCSPLAIPDDFKGLEGAHTPVYFLISGKQGECSYARKVENAKKGLAKGVIIVDSPQGINNLRLRLQEKDTFITLLISETEGAPLLKSTSFVGELTMGGKSSSKTRKNEMEIWVSSLNQESYNILSQWKSILEEVSTMGGQLTWTPRFAFYSCDSDPSCKSGFISSCACGGQFCSPELHAASSNVLVREDIRQHLIFKSSPEKYLSYVNRFKKICFQAYAKNFNSDDCATGIMHELEINAGINTQIDHFLTSCQEQEEQSNFKMYQALALDRAKYSQIGHYPTVILNHQQLEFRSKEEFKNAVCRKLSLEDSSCGVLVQTTTIFSKIVSGFFYFLLITLLLGAGGFVVLFFRNKLRREMNKELKMQVSTAVEHYFTLSESQHH